MKQKHKRVLTRALALAMTVCMSVQMLPVQVFAAELEEQRILSELEEQKENIERLEKELEDELGMSLEEAYAQAGISVEDSQEELPMLMTAAASTDEVVTEDYVVGEVICGTFTFNKTTQTITKYAQAGTAPTGYTLTVPAEIGGVEVLSIGTGKSGTAAVSANKAEKIVLPEGLVTVGAGAFRSCYSVTEISLPTTLKTIESYAFYGCSKLTSIAIPEDVTSIGGYAFYNCYELVSVSMPETLETIEANTFYGCSKLASIEIPDGVMSIGASAFQNCSALTGIALPEGVEIIENNAFYGCSKLASIKIPASVTSIGEYAFNGCAALTSVVIPANVTSIGNSAFRNCTSLKTVTFAAGSKLESIDRLAFDGCSALQSITLPGSIKTLGMYTFQKCTSLETADLSALTVTSLPGYFMSGCTKLATLTLPVTLTTLGSNCFEKCTALESVSLPAGLTGIESSAFNGAGLKSITLPEGLKGIGGSAFQDCKALASVNFPDSITSLGSWAFMGCTSLTAADLSSLTVTKIPSKFMSGCTALESLTLPPALKTVDKKAFYNCTSLKSVSFPATLTEVGESAFENVPLISLSFANGERSYLRIYKMAFKNNHLTALTLPDIGTGYYHLYAEAFGGEKLTTLTVGVHDYASDKVDASETNYSTVSGNYDSYVGPFNGQPLTTVTLPADCTVVPNGLFGTSKLDNLDFLDSRVTQVGKYAFYGCDTLDQADFNALLPRVTAMGDFAFSDCDGLTTIPTTQCETFAIYAFAKCNNLVSVADQPGLKVINEAVFYSCKALTTLGAMQPTDIQRYAFYDCDKLTATPDMTLVYEVRDQAFYNCDSLTEIKFYDALTYMGDSIVAECANLTTVTFVDTDSFFCKDNGASNITNNPFKGNTSIIPANITIPAKMTRLPDRMFACAEFLTDLTFLPETVTAYGDCCFQNSSLTEVVIPAHITSVGLNAFSNNYYSDSTSGKLAHLEILCPATVFKGQTFVRQPLQDPDTSEDKSSVILPDDWTQIPYGLFFASHITDIDFLSEMDSLTTIGACAFQNCSKLTSLNLPTRNDLTIGGFAFSGSLGNIESLTIPANVKELTGYEENGKLYYQHFYHNGVNLKHVYVLNPELDLQQENFRKDDYDRYLVFNYYYYSGTNKLTIHGAEGSTAALLVAAEAAYTGVAGSERYKFEALKAAEPIIVTVTYGETDLTNQCTIQWYDSAGRLRGTGATIDPHMTGDTYRYVITLDDTIAATYYAPAEGFVTTSDVEAQTIPVALREIGVTTFTGKAVDEDGSPISAATVTLRQSVNGVDLPELSATTNADGTFTVADAKDVYTEVIVSKSGRYNGVFLQMEPSGAETTDLGTVTMKELPSLTFALNVRSRTADGISKVVTDLDAFTFEVVDAGSSENYGKNLNFSLQGSLLILEEPEKDYLLRSGYPLVLEVSADEEKLGAVLAGGNHSISFATGDQAVYVTLNEKGRFTMEPAAYSGAGQYVWVYDKNGRLCDAYEMESGYVESAPLNAGTYTAVVIDSTVPLYNPTELSLLTKTLKMKSGEHFYQTEFEVKNGEITALTGFTVPTLDTQATAKLFTDMFKTAKISRTVTAPVIGQEYYLIFEYELKDEYKNSGEKTLTFSLPAGTDFNSIATPYGTDTFSPSVSPNVTTLTVTTTANAGRIHLAVQSGKVNWVSAFSAVLTSGNQVSKPVSESYPIRDIDIEMGSKEVTRTYNRHITITAIPGSEVHLYVDGVEPDYLDDEGQVMAGYTPRANQAGTCQVIINLPGPTYEGRIWRLTADSTKGDTFVESYETETITYKPDPFDPVITAQIQELPEAYQENADYWNQRWGHNVVIRINDNYQSAPYINTTEDPNIWEVRVAEGMGQYIEGNTIWLTCGYLVGGDHRGGRQPNISDGEKFDLPMYRVSEDPNEPDYDLFRGVGPTDTDYVGVDYDTTEEYKEMVKNQIPAVSQADVDARNAEIAEQASTASLAEIVALYPELENALDDLEHLDLSGTLTDPTFAAEMDAIIAAGETASPEDVEGFDQLPPEEQQKVLEMERRAKMLLEEADGVLMQGVDLLVPGREIDWTKSGDALMAQLGYTEEPITDAELAIVAADESYVALQNGDTLMYHYSSDTLQITVNTDTMTKTTVDISGTTGSSLANVMRYNNSNMRMLRSTRSAETDKESLHVNFLEAPEGLSASVSEANTAIGSWANSVDIAIEGIKEALGDYRIGGNPKFYSAATRAALSAKLSLLLTMKSLVSRVASILTVGSIAILLRECYSNYSDYRNAVQYFEKVKKSNNYSYECARAAKALCDAYADYGINLGLQLANNLASIVAMAVLGGGVFASGGSTGIALAIYTIGSMIADLVLGHFADGHKENIKQKKKDRELACEGSRGGGSDDGAPTDVINDPSGYVYEAVFSNRVAGATATTYYEGTDGSPVKWKAEEYNQLNPLATTPDGFYRWDVPRGNWMVTVEKEGYNIVDSRDIYKKLGTLGADSDGWLPVLPVQTEVHLPMESTEAPQVYEYIAYEDGISLIFSQYMKEETLNITVADKNGTFSGNQLKLVWVDQEESDHYYNRSFASELMITRADGEYWTAKEDGTVTVSIAAGGENYAGTDLDSWTQTMKLLPAPAEFTAEAKVSVTYGGERIVTVAVTDRNGKAVAGASVDAEVSGYALVRQAGEETFSTVSYGETDKNGMASFTLSGYCVGEDTLTVSLAGRSEQLEIPVAIARSGVPNEPMVTINGTVYTGQGHEIEVEKGTVITVTGGSEDVLYYNIGRNSCPCQGDQILIGTGSGTITVNESGYYKFAAYDPENELYSSRVHVLITVKAGEAGTAVTAVTPAADGLSISVAGEISNGTGAALTGDLWCAAYNADGRMIGLELLGKQEAAVGGGTPVSGTVALSENWAAGCSVKLLFLHPDTAAPLAKAEAYTAQ